MANDADTGRLAQPAYDPNLPLIVFDGSCVMCSGFARMVLAVDRKAVFRFATAQSPLGQALYAAHGLKGDDFDTNLVIIDGVAHQRLESLIAVMVAVGFPFNAARLLLVLPGGWRDAIYGAIARNRFRLFAQKDTCDIPSPALRARIVG